MSGASSLVLEPLTAEAFSPFGDVLWAGACDEATARGANQGSAVRFDWAAILHNAREAAKPNLAVFRCRLRALPFAITVLERHPFSSQAFLPLRCSRYAVVVAPAGPDGEPEWSKLRAFQATSGQGINYHANVWHHPMIALDGAGADPTAEFAMLAWEDGSPLDCEERHLDSPVVQIVAAGPFPLS